MQQQQDTISLTFGIVSYLRNFFSEDSFETVECPDGNKNLKLKVLRHTKETQKILEWIREIQTKKKDIHKIILGIYNLERELVEMYAFDLRTELDFKGICRTMQKMEALQGRYALKMKIFSMAGTIFKGFKKRTELWEIADKREVEFNGFKIHFKGPDLSDTGHNGITDRNGINNGKNSDQNSITDDKNVTIDCQCTINTNERDMLQCTSCLNWTHATCNGYFSIKDKRIPETFICYKCLGENSMELRNCCIYRRVLWIVFNETVNCNNLANVLETRLRISLPMAKRLVNKLKKDGFIKWESFQFSVGKDSTVKEKIKEYFNGARMDCNISNDEIELKNL